MNDEEIIKKAIQKYEKETHGLDETEYEESHAFEHSLKEAVVLARTDEKSKWEENSVWIDHLAPEQLDKTNSHKNRDYIYFQLMLWKGSGKREVLKQVLEWFETKNKNDGIKDFKEKFGLEKKEARDC